MIPRPAPGFVDVRLRAALLVFAFGATGCAVAEDPGSAMFQRDSGVGPTDSGGVDSSAQPDTAQKDTSAVDDTSVAADTSGDTSVGDTGATDTGATDTGATDTGASDTSSTEGGACVVAGCTTSSGDRLTCATGRTIGRRTAGPLAGYIATGIPLPLPTGSSITDGTLLCPALGPDHAYKLFMRKGETATVTLAAKTADVVLSTLFWESLDCATNVCAGSPFKCGSSTGGSYTATGDGWVTIVVAGQTPFDFGSYDIKVVLTGCKTTDCECP
ncbi:MAG: hypothetical protein HYV09_14625 [Deltaproteobacteria bacterium]|nr:hypothetical protein [Deltaproteobacteria bacterium]